MESLRGWRDIENIHFNSVGLVRFKARKFNLSGLDEKCAIRSHKLILCLIDGEASHCFSAGQQLSVNLSFCVVNEFPRQIRGFPHYSPASLNVLRC